MSTGYNHLYKTIECAVRPQIRRWRAFLHLVVEEDDLVQETLLRLIESGKTEGPEGYWKRTAKHCCIDAKRKEGREGQKVELEDVAVEEDLIGVQRIWLENQLNELTWEQEKRIRMRLNGLSLEEVAQAFKESYSTSQREEQKVLDLLKRQVEANYVG